MIAMRKLSLCVSAVLAASILASLGCSSAAADPIVGSWTADLSAGGTTGMAEYTFNGDKSFSGTFKGKLPTGTGEMQATQTGKWEYDADKKLKVTVSSMDLKLVGATPEMEKMLADANTPESKKKMVDEANKAPSSAVTWKGNDEFSATLSGQALTFKRKK